MRQGGSRNTRAFFRTEPRNPVHSIVESDHLKPLGVFDQFSHRLDGPQVAEFVLSNSYSATIAGDALGFVGISKAITVRIISRFASFGCAKR